MADIEVGQTFIDFHSSSLHYKSKPKYHIAMSCADFEGDDLVCFIMHTERNFEKYTLNCNKKVQKFIIPPNTFSFITNHTAIMLATPCFYKYEEMLESHIKLKDVADELLCRQIKNCIDWSFIPTKMASLIK